MQVVLIVGLCGCFIAAGLLMVYIAVVDVKTRLISSRVLLSLLILRLMAAGISCVINPMLSSVFFTEGDPWFSLELSGNEEPLCFFGYENKEFERIICCLCVQLSLSSLSVSCLGSLVIVLFLKMLIFLTDAFIARFHGKNIQKKYFNIDYKAKKENNCTFKLVDNSVTEKRLDNKGEKNTSLGLGDVLLTGVCCLYLAPAQIEVFLLIVALGGVLFAGVAYLIRRTTTFPFAPVIVLGCMIAFLF